MAISFKDCSTILQQALLYATGQEVEAPLNTSQFVSLATTALDTGVDPIMQALSTMLSRTIFSVRPYNARFTKMRRDSAEWGNHIRKITILDDAPESDERGMVTQPTVGEGLTPYKWQPANVLQTNFYGGQVYQRSKMFTRDQINNAFTGPEEFGSFVEAIMQNARDMREQDFETMARMCLANYIGGKVTGSTADVIHLLTEYNALTGQSLTATTVFAPDNFASFIQFMYARIADVSNKLTERNINYHTNFTDKLIMRHTPKDRQVCYFLSDYYEKIKAMVLAGTFNENLLDLNISEMVNYWQSIDDPDAINVTPSYSAADGSITTASQAVATSNIVAVLVDYETLGLTSQSEWSGVTPMDVRHGITNMYWHYTLRYWNDFTENGAIFLLD